MWGRIRAILFENLGLKLASLLLAFLLYVHVVTDQERERVVSVPIAAIGLPDTLTATGVMPQRVQAKVRGKWKDLIRLNLTRPVLSIDLAAAKPGPFQTSIRAEDIQKRALPPDLLRQVTVTEVLEPRSVDLVIEPKGSRYVHVAARIVGQPAPGYRVQGKGRVTPDSIRVQGPSTILRGVDTVYTVAVDITGEREKIQRQVGLDLPPSLASVETRRCLVTLEVAKAEPESLSGGH